MFFIVFRASEKGLRNVDNDSVNFGKTRIMKDKFEAAELAERYALEQMTFRLHKVLDAIDPEAKKLPIYWTIDPPQDCWYVLFDPNMTPKNTYMVGGEERVICVSKADGAVIYDTMYGTE